MAMGTYALIGGVTSLAGYVFDIRLLTDWDNDDISIQPNAAVCAAFSGLALLMISAQRRRIAAACAAVVLFIGGLTLVQWIFGISLGHDGILLFGREWGRKGVISPGRMGPPGSLSWTLIGSALVLTALSAGWANWRRVAPVFALLTLAVSALSLMG